MRVVVDLEPSRVQGFSDEAVGEAGYEVVAA